MIVTGIVTGNRNRKTIFSFIIENWKFKFSGSFISNATEETHLATKRLIRNSSVLNKNLSIFAMK